MSLLAMLKKGRPQGFATAIPATFATVDSGHLPKVARVARVAVANLQTPAANDPTPDTTVQADLSGPDVKGLPTTPTDSAVIDIGTVRPPGLSPALLAASQALDAHIHAAGLLPGNDADRWCYPDSTAMTGAEIDTFTARLSRFTDKGVIQSDAERLADLLVIRDRESDDRRLCNECLHLGGYGPQSWRCGNWQAAGIAINPRSTQLAPDLVFQLQRCAGLTHAFTPTPVAECIRKATESTHGPLAGAGGMAGPANPGNVLRAVLSGLSIASIN
jgi:hypothetical protein